MMARITILALIALASMGCQPKRDIANAASAVPVDAVVRFIDIEGGCWVLELSSGQRVQPLGLPKDLYRDGLAISVQLEHAESTLTTCQTGIPMRVVSAEVRR